MVMFETEIGEREKGEGEEERRGGVMRLVSLRQVWDTPVLNSWVKEGTRKRDGDLGVTLQKLRRGYFLEGEFKNQVNKTKDLSQREGWQEQREL